jgi:membrane protein CcdC involved in cytochrome C biogenesis
MHLNVPKTESSSTFFKLEYAFMVVFKAAMIYSFFQKSDQIKKVKRHHKQVWPSFFGGQSHFFG